MKDGLNGKAGRVYHAPSSDVNDLANAKIKRKEHQGSGPQNVLCASHLLRSDES
jgi:hypothetical protein